MYGIKVKIRRNKMKEFSVIIDKDEDVFLLPLFRLSEEHIIVSLFSTPQNLRSHRTVPRQCRSGVADGMSC